MDAPANARTVAQTTLAGPATLTGIGVHGGRPARLVIEPAPPDTGIVFRLQAGGLGGLADRLRGRRRDVPASWRNVRATRLATVLAGRGTRRLRTVEHLMAALAGLGVDNAVVAVDGPEVPILDGSAAPFVAAIDAAGLVPVGGARRILRVLRPVSVTLDDRSAALEPGAGDRLDLDVAIDFPDAAIGRQQIALTLSPGVFRAEVAPARTFGRARDLRTLRRLGYGRGASLDNAIGVEEDKVLNPEGLRFPDEFVRHKLLDAVGDLALAGLPIAGRFRSVKGGHRLNHAVLATLFAEPGGARVEWQESHS